MAVNNNTTDNLYPAYDTGVKFYASLTRAQAKGTASIGTDDNGNLLYVEPGAVCFVSDASGNSIFLNNRLFGDGAISGGGSGGGITEVTLSDIVVVEVNGQILKTLSDYFDADGTVISDGFKVLSTRTNDEGTEYQVEVVVIDETGITIGGSRVVTEDDLEALKQEIMGDSSSSAQELADAAEQNAKNYADSLLSSVYKIKGSVTSYSDLVNISNPKGGDVYNVVNEYGISGTADFIPAGTNYVWVEVTDTSNSKYPGYWDPLGGTINLSAYKTAANTTAEIQEALVEAKNYAQGLQQDLSGTISAMNTAIAGIDTRVQTNTTNISNIQGQVSTNTTNIETNTTNITNIATQLTWQ